MEPIRATFQVERRGGAPITVQLDRAAWIVWDNGEPSERFDLLGGAQQLAEYLACLLVGEWNCAGDEHVARVRRVMEGISGRVGREHANLITGAEPQVVAVQRATLAVADRVPALAMAAQLYDYPYVVRDVIHYRAAAIALTRLESEFWPHVERLRSASFASVVQQRPVPGGWRRPAGEMPDRKASLEELLSAMADWRGLFSPTGRSYRTLNRVLMNLPEAVPPSLVSQLRHVRLVRPIVNATELSLLVRWLKHRAEFSYRTHESHLPVYQHATEAQIHRAFERIGRHTNRALNPVSDSDLHFVVNFLLDYREPYRGDFAGLVDRAIRWHEAMPVLRAIDRLKELGGPDRRVATPPLPLPNIEGITFLASVGAIFEEGRRMGHCIASYAERAIHGESFLFHIDHAGEMASIEVTAPGQVRQASGPHNCDNLAAQWGSLQLRAWAAQ